MTENITNPNVTNTTLFGLEAGAEYNVSMLAYAHLPVQRGSFTRFQLNGEWLLPLAHCGFQLNEWSDSDKHISYEYRIAGIFQGGKIFVSIEIYASSWKNFRVRVQYSLNHTPCMR